VKSSSAWDVMEAPQLRWAARWQAVCVDRIKRAALRQLHATTAGECHLLRMYLAGEVATEVALKDDMLQSPQKWLQRQVQHHLCDEARHARLFAEALGVRGVRVDPQDPSIAPQDPVSRRKLRQMHALARAQTARFQAGVLVPAYALGLCAEQMAQRVLTRHREVIGPMHPLYPLLSDVLSDEERHVRLCAHALRRLVRPEERAALAALMQKVRAMDRAWGITGAISMWALGLICRVRAWRPHASGRAAARRA
jgi:hypothetical protein